MEAINVFIEGGTAAETKVVSLLLNNALYKAGFKELHQHDEDGQERYVSPEVQRLTAPSVLEYLRENKPELFQMPVVVSAYTPAPVSPERRELNRVWLRAREIASSFADVDPDEVWSQLGNREKEQLLRGHDSRRTEYAY